MNRAIVDAIQHDRITYLQSHLREYLPVESLIDKDEDNINLDLEFSITEGFTLTLSDAEATISVPSDLLAIEYSEEVDLAVLDNHPEEYPSDDPEEAALIFESHLEHGCPPCRESRNRIMQSLEQTLKSHLDFYSEELVMYAEQKLLEADLVGDVSVDVVQTQNVEIHLNLEEPELGDLQDLEIVQERMASRFDELASKLPEELGIEVKDGVLISKRLVFLLRHTSLTEHKIELFIARQLLPKDGEDAIPDKEISAYTTKTLGKSTISKYLAEVERVLDDFHLLAC